MSSQKANAIKRVLVEAVELPHFFDLCDAERMNWMIGRAFELGVEFCRLKRPSDVKLQTDRQASLRNE